MSNPVVNAQVESEVSVSTSHQGNSVPECVSSGGNVTSHVIGQNFIDILKINVYLTQ